MNPEQTSAPTEAVSAVLVSSGPPRWKQNLIYLLQIVGIILAALAGGDFLGIFNLFSPELSAKLAVAGPSLYAGARPVLLLLGDLFDDGVRNNSFTLDEIPRKPKDDPNQLPLLAAALIVGIIALMSVACVPQSFALSKSGNKGVAVEIKFAK